MKTQKITTYLAACIAISACSATPTYSVTLTTGAAALTGLNNPTAVQILTLILANPSVLTNPAQYGLTGPTPAFQQSTGNGTLTATLSPPPITKPNGTSLTASATGTATVTNTDYSLGSNAQGTLTDMGGADQKNGAVAGALIQDNLTINSTSQLAGSTGTLILNFSVTGSTSQTNPAVQSLGVVSITGNPGTTPYVLKTLTGNNINTIIPTAPINFTYGTPLPLNVALGSVVNIPGGLGTSSSPATNSGTADLFHILKLQGITVKDSAGNVVPLSNINIVNSSGVNLKNIIAVAAPASVPEPSSVWGIFAFGVLGGGWTLKRKLLKHLS